MLGNWSANFFPNNHSSSPLFLFFFNQVSSEVKTPLRASIASKAATDWPSRGAASPHSTAFSGYRPTTASTRKTTPPLCMATNPRAPSKTTWGSAQTWARINPSSQQQHWQDTQVLLHIKRSHLIQKNFRPRLVFQHVLHSQGRAQHREGCLGINSICVCNYSFLASLNQ